MVYFLRPSNYSLKRNYAFNPLAGNNLLVIAGSAVLALVVVMVVVQLQRPCWMNLCNKNDLDSKGKPKVNWLRTSLFALLVALLVAGAAAGVMYAMEPKDAASGSPAPAAM